MMERAGSVPAADGAGLVGRRAEVRRLEELARRAAAGQATMVLVEGPGGIGKSALVGAALERLGPSASIARVRASEMERRLDFGVLAQLYRHAVAFGIRRLPDRGEGELRPDPLDVGQEIVRTLRGTTMAGLTVFAIDDAHWADPASLQSIAYAYRRLQHAPVLVVLAHRPATDLLDEFERLVHDGRAEVIRVGALGPHEVAELVRQRTGVRVSRTAARRLHDHTDGCPLDVLALADELPGDVLASGIGDLPAPRSFASVVLARLASCSADAEAVALAVAVLGRPTEPATLATMLGCDDVGPAIDEAIERGLVRVSRSAGRRLVDVEHPLVRAAIVDDVAPSRLAEAHRRAATVTPDPDRALLHRLRGVTGVDRRLGEDAMSLATERLQAGWTLVAVELLLGAAEVLGPGPRRTQARLTAALGLASTGELADATQLLATVPPDAGGALRPLVAGVLGVARGDVGGARDDLERAHRLAEQAGDEEVASRAACELAAMANHSVDAAASLTWARAALRRGPISDAGPSMSTIAWAWSQLGDLPAGRAEIDAWASRVPPGDREPADATFSRGLIAMWSGEHQQAIDLLGHVAHTSIGRASLATVAGATYSLADAEYRAGSWDLALAHATGLTDALAAAGHHLSAPMAHGVAAFVLAGRGDVDEARRRMELGYQAREATGVPAGWLWLEVASARLALAQDDHAGAVDHYDKIAAFLADQPVLDVVQPWRADFAVALVATGQPEQARRQLAALHREASTSAHARAGVARAEGALALAEGDHDAAAFAHQQALEDDPSATGPFERARLELAAGSLERRRGRRRRAAELLEQAGERFSRLGAEPYAARARSELARRGAERHARTGELTPTERTVAGLVASGRTNREIAADLVVSIKTVETHVAHIYAKLGVRSRTELARQWVDEAP